jgi:diketogulonate reductase-like aldo/keto reductase
MRKRSFGPLEVDVPVVGLGTWHMEKTNHYAAIEAISRAIDLGMTHIDTAELYGDGAVERLVGEAIQFRRDEVFLVSKVHPDHATREGTVKACENSLRRLRTDHLDVYLLHWLGDVPLEDTVAGFEDLVQAGKIRAWGVSNFDENELAEVERIAGEGRVACDQVLYHLRERSIEHAVVPYCAEHGIAVVGYSPFGSGHFPVQGAPGFDVLSWIARERGVTPHEVALAFLVREPPLFTIPKASTLDHVRQCAAAGELVLTDDETRRLEEAFPRGPRRLGVPMI